jgi:hypothetical protein
MKMDTNTTAFLIVIIIAIVIIIGFIIFRQKAKVGINVHGNKLNFEGSNDTTSKVSNSKARSNGIFRNFLIGKSDIEVHGKGTVADNIGVGNTKINKSDKNSNLVEPETKRNKKS